MNYRPESHSTIMLLHWRQNVSRNVQCMTIDATLKPIHNSSSTIHHHGFINDSEDEPITFEFEFTTWANLFWHGIFPWRAQGVCFAKNFDLERIKIDNRRIIASVYPRSAHGVGMLLLIRVPKVSQAGTCGTTLISLVDSLMSKHVFSSFLSLHQRRLPSSQHCRSSASSW